MNATFAQMQRLRLYKGCAERDLGGKDLPKPVMGVRRRYCSMTEYGPLEGATQYSWCGWEGGYRTTGSGKAG